MQTTTTHHLGPNPHSPTLTVTVSRDWQGVSLTVLAGPTYSSTLSRTFTHDRLAAGRIWYAHLRDAANAGLPVWRIEADMQALLAAGAALTAEAVSA